MGHVSLEYEKSSPHPEEEERKASIKGDETGRIAKIATGIPYHPKLSSVVKEQSGRLEAGSILPPISTTPMLTSFGVFVNLTTCTFSPIMQSMDNQTKQIRVSAKVYKYLRQEAYRAHKPMTEIVDEIISERFKK